jgi:hypothetical protein
MAMSAKVLKIPTLALVIALIPASAYAVGVSSDNGSGRQHLTNHGGQL